MEGVRVLDDDVVHMHGAEPGELAGEGDQVDGRVLVKLVEVRVAAVVPLPSKAHQDLLERLVGGHHLAARQMDQGLPSGVVARGFRLRILHEPVNAFLEHPDPRHYINSDICSCICVCFQGPKYGPN